MTLTGRDLKPIQALGEQLQTMTGLRKQGKKDYKKENSARVSVTETERSIPASVTIENQRKWLYVVVFEALFQNSTCLNIYST